MDTPIDNSQVRRLLNHILKSDSDFDAFCFDHFPDVHRRFNRGMDRVERVTLLFLHRDPAAVFAKLADIEPRLKQDRESILASLPRNHGYQNELSRHAKGSLDWLHKLLFALLGLDLLLTLWLLTRSHRTDNEAPVRKAQPPAAVTDGERNQIVFSHLVATDQDDYFGLNNKKELVWFGSFTPKTDPETLPICPIKIASGWDYQFVFSAGQGILYGVTLGGELFWHRYMHGHDTAPPTVVDRKRIGNGLAGYSFVFGGIDGVIYAMTDKKSLLKYKHSGWREGAPSLTKTREIGNIDIPAKAVTYRSIFSTRAGIYAIDQEDLMWFFIISPEQDLSEKLTWYQADNGWHTRHVFAGPSRMIIGADVYRQGVCGASYNLFNNEHHLPTNATVLTAWRASWCSAQCESAP